MSARLLVPMPVPAWFPGPEVAVAVVGIVVMVVQILKSPLSALIEINGLARNSRGTVRRFDPISTQVPSQNTLGHGPDDRRGVDIGLLGSLGIDPHQHRGIVAASLG